MATNYIQDGQTVTWTNGTGTAVASGGVVVIGSQLGVAIGDIAIGDSGAVVMEGVVELPKGSNAITLGAAVDYDVSASAVDVIGTPAAGDLVGCGVAWAAAAAGDATVVVKLNTSAANVT